ncbi:histidine phosphatase family protein [Tissierella sp. Yu-01]|uniref:SixA phosphatase family protein n=1 Tax=Tissierella sp. Yu-01 TaxID=3035694 RepID=UPI00240E831D|nr:histidine phosphatase family protein [Tissierella sp. Yu-01]WFA07764.1 histidine phosphatase family protein [Tissierella sp. Yu-01]
MSKYIILYRHGMAVDKATAASDDLRSLSIRGRRLLNKSIAGFKIMLGKHKYVKIYSSPKLRAAQTAEMLSSELNLSPPQYYDFLATGGNIRLLREILEEIEPGSVAVIVGHQPFLSVWSQELSGFYLPFKKGTAACYKFPNEITEKKAELRWYLQTRDFIKIKGKEHIKR